MLQSFNGPLTNFRIRYPQLTGPQVRRQDSCGFCDSLDAESLAKADYWDLAEIELVRCKACGLMQVDPMLVPDVVSEGCLALYRHQQSGESERSRRRGLYRAFRHGVAFGVSLKLKGISPKRVLEVGAGDGYFLKGVQYVFPEATYVGLDLVDEILQALKTKHGFQTIHSSLEDVDPVRMGQFDLVIARDILEHVTRPGLVLAKLSSMIEPLGRLFFITPNGWQDAWQMFSRWKVDGARSELLINHVNYFEPESLRVRLEDLGFNIEDWFIYNLKTFFRGAGWRLIEKHKARRSERRSAKKVISESSTLSTTFAKAADAAIPRVYASSSFEFLLRPVLMAYCWFKHTPFLRVKPSARVGEEIFCLAQKKSTSV